MITIYRTKYDDCLNQPQSICSCVSQIADYPAKYKNCSDLSKFFPTDFVYSTQISYTVKIYSYCVVYMLQCSVLFLISKLTESSNKWTFSFELLKFKGSVSVISDKKMLFCKDIGMRKLVCGKGLILLFFLVVVV